MFEGRALGAERNIAQKCSVFFGGKRPDNKSLKVQILLSRNVGVIAQAPKYDIVVKMITYMSLWFKKWIFSKTPTGPRGTQSPKTPPSNKK